MIDKTFILYSTGCPRCEVLKKKLNAASIEFSVNDNVDEMSKLGITMVPVLRVDDELLNFSDAVKYINSFTEDK